MRLKVLLVTTDLYRKVGGGETVYRKIISSSPDIDFFYFRHDETADTERPTNVTAIPLKYPRKLEILVPPPFPDYRQLAQTKADRIALSVANMGFDVVDLADFFDFGSMLRNAFYHHNVKVGRVVLALHGNISISMEMQWGSAGNNVLEQRTLEREQFDAADAVYAISPRYIEEWRKTIDREVHLINPLNFVQIGTKGSPVNTRTLRSPFKKPNLYCIGRMERRKGNDLFVEIVRWLNKDNYDKVQHIGDQVTTPEGTSSQYLLEKIAETRGINIGFSPALTRTELEKIYKDKSVVILPARYDTLNLVALEALFAGCPVVISDEAGVCSFLDKEFPEIPYIKIDFNNFYGVVSKIDALLADYDNYRSHLEQKIQEVSSRLQPQLDIASVYRRALETPARQKASDHLFPYHQSPTQLLSRIKRIIRLLAPLKYLAIIRHFVFESFCRIKMGLRRAKYVGDMRVMRFLVDTPRVARRLLLTSHAHEYNEAFLMEKLQEIYDFASNPLYRCNFWHDIARIERQLGHDLIAATYELRLLRLLGRDTLGVLPNVLSTLKAKGMDQEASAAQALYGDPKHAAENVYSYLKEASTRNLTNQEQPFERINDRRQGQPRVSVIVSLYNAAPKLKFFLTSILQQTLIRKDASQVELILIDSGSPSNEAEVMQAFWQEIPVNAVYARSVKRETIQAAWNRGIHLAKAPYLVFLGADEGLYPEALEILADTLDRNPTIDWAMGNSLVTDVDPRGVYKNDVMPYNRKGGTKDHVYLETCYISWVGGMYRKSIHDRCGYYDETFTGAGDTEFKNRILPHIQVKYIPDILGLFFNYPEDRTTASSRVEIEDLRAWYIHRTPGGVRYAFENRPLQDVEKLLLAALSYRKSYCGHISTDIEYAKYLADYLIEKKYNVDYLPTLAQDLGVMLETLRMVEFADKSPSSINCFRVYNRAWKTFKKYRTEHRKLLRDSIQPAYSLINDNRYEQHSWLWKSEKPETK